MDDPSCQPPSLQHSLSFLQHYGHINSLDLKEIFNDNDEHEIPSITHSFYYDYSSLVENMSVDKNSLSVLSLNCQSLNAKIDQLNLFCELLNRQHCGFDVICLQETWLGAGADVSLLQLNDYALITQPKSSSLHGGLAIFLKKSFSYLIHPRSLPSDLWETQVITIFSDRLISPVIIGNIYRPPRNNNEQISTFLEEFLQYLNIITDTNKQILISGDFNMNLLTVRENHQVNEFLNNVLSSGLLPSITFPTRFAERSASLIDNIFTNSSHPDLITAGILTSQISDHQPCFVLLKNSFKSYHHTNQSRTEIRKRSPNFNVLVKHDFSQADIMSKLNLDPNTDPNINYNILEETITDIMNKHTTTKYIKFNKHKHKNNEWITNGILTSIKFRDRLHLRLKRSAPDTLDRNNLKINISTYNRILKKTIRSAKAHHYNNLFDQYKDDPKNTWKQINKLLNRNVRSDSSFSHLTQNGSKIVDPTQISNEFNTFFSSIGEKTASSIRSSTHSFQRYLNNRDAVEFQFCNITTEEVIKVIQSLKNKTSSAADSISAILIKELKTELAEPLTLIINQVINTCKFPEKLKLAKVIPIHKKGDLDNCNNYRPISLLPTISKIVEKILLKQLYTHFQTNNLLFPHQYGFRKQRSTEHAALEFVDRLLIDIDQNKTPISIFLDLSKAFDCLQHPILLKKLQYYGITGNSLDLCTDYLSNRQQFVSISSTSSTLRPIKTGVPQGSILGPFLFLVYINDFNNASNCFKMINYADDTTLLTTLNTDLLASQNEINEELTKILEWLCANKLSLNTSKTKFITFHLPQKQISSPQLIINNEPITQTKTFDFLGITINENLNWNPHIGKISNKISKICGILSKLKHLVPQFVLHTLYNSLIAPHINYGILLWGQMTNKILKLQKRAVRTIVKQKYNAHTDPIFRKLQILKVDDLKRMCELKFYHKYVNNSLPEYFLTNFISTNNDVHNRLTRNSDKLVVPVHRRQCFRSGLRFTIVKTVNESSDNVISKCSTHSLNSFSKYVKNKYINNYSLMCTRQNCYICQNN